MCFLIKEYEGKIDKICLAQTKTQKDKIGSGMLNTYGGKVEQGEAILDAVARELHEESSVKVNKDNLQKVGILKFPTLNIISYIYKTNTWQGSPKDSKDGEMTNPKWYSFNEIPFNKMWDCDKYWYPLMFQNRYFEGEIHYNKNSLTSKINLDII